MTEFHNSDCGYWTVNFTPGTAVWQKIGSPNFVVAVSVRIASATLTCDVDLILALTGSRLYGAEQLPQKIDCIIRSGLGCMRQ